LIGPVKGDWPVAMKQEVSSGGEMHPPDSFEYREESDTKDVKNAPRMHEGVDRASVTMPG
jgi:hypothetical protein